MPAKEDNKARHVVMSRQVDGKRGTKIDMKVGVKEIRKAGGHDG